MVLCMARLTMGAHVVGRLMAIGMPDGAGSGRLIEAWFCTVVFPRWFRSADRGRGDAVACPRVSAASARLVRPIEPAPCVAGLGVGAGT